MQIPLKKEKYTLTGSKVDLTIMWCLTINHQILVENFIVFLQN